jgi:hypothetical protein
MSNAMNPAAPHHLPSFITAPGETDLLLTGAAVFLVVLVLVLGSTYFWLHSIPERIAHGAGKIQFQLVAVLSLLALFTHNNAFWIGALLLALIPIPDFWTPLAEMAESLAKMAGRRLRTATTPAPQATAHEEGASDAPPAPPTAMSAAPPPEAGITSRQVDNGAGVTPAALTEPGDGKLPAPDGERPAVAAKAAGGKRRALSREGA